MKKLIILSVASLLAGLLFFVNTQAEVVTDPGVTGVIPDDYYVKSSDFSGYTSTLFDNISTPGYLKVAGASDLNGTATITGGLDVNLAGDDNFTIDGSTNNRTITIGAFRQLHTPAIPGTRAVNFVIDANSQADTKAVVVEYTATGLGAGETVAGLQVDIDTADSTGGIIDAFAVDSTGTGSILVHALHAGIGIAPIHQDSGALKNIEQAFLYDDSLTSFTNVTGAFKSTGTDVQMFVENNDLVYIGDDAVFSTVSFLLETVASGAGVKPEFYYWSGAAWSEFGPTDATNGYRIDGNVSWTADDLSGWATTAVNGDTKYWIYIKRTATNLATPPTEDIVQVAAPVNYTWDENGDAILRNISTLGYVDANRVIVDAGLVTEPSIAFGDGDSGFFEATDDTLILTLAEQSKWRAEGNNFSAQNVNGALLINRGAQIAQTTICPSRVDDNTGVGWGGEDILSLIAGDNTTFLAYSTFNESVLPLVVDDDLTVAGLQSFSAITTIFGDYSAINNMNQILCDATAGEIDVHVASASGVKGRIGNVKKIDVSVNDCIIEPAGAETIDGVANYAISTQWENITYFTDVTNLLIQ